MQGLCFQAEQGGSWTNCVCPQEIRDAGGLPGSGAGPCGQARWQDPSATQQRSPNSEAVQPQPAQGGEAWLHSRTSSQLSKLSCFFPAAFSSTSATCFSLSFPFSLFPVIPALPLPWTPLALKLQQPFHPLGARGFPAVWTVSFLMECNCCQGSHFTKSPASPNPILFCSLAHFFIFKRTPCSLSPVTQGQRLSWQLEQRSRDPKEPRRSPSPARHPEKVGRTRGDSPRPASPSWLLERGSRSPRSASPARRSERRAGEPLNAPCRAEKSWRSRGEPARPPNSERGRATWQAGGTRQALEKKSRGDPLHPAGAGRGSDNARLGRAGPPPPRALSPGRRADSTRKSQKEISPPSLVRGAERQRGKPGEPLHLAGPRKASECSWQSLREKLTSSQPAKGTCSEWKGRGKPLRPMSPTRALEQDWRGRGGAHQAQAWEKDWKRQEVPVCHADVMRQLERDWKSPARCLDVGLRSDDSWKRPESPAQHLEEEWKGPEHARDTQNPEKPLENDWGNRNLLIYHVSRAGARGDGDPERSKIGKHTLGGSPGLQSCAL